MENPKISVIVPVYNVEPYLRKCLDSIINQTYQNLEIILVDDGSPDNCGAICDEYEEKDERITVIHQENGGVAAARNAGLSAASGDWLGWVDPDDYIEPDMYEYLLTHALAHDADVAVCTLRTMEDEQEKADRVPPRGKMALLNREQAIEQYLRGELHYGCVNKLSRFCLWKGFRFPDYRMAEDVAVLWRLFERAETTIRLPEEKYICCRRSGSITASKGAQARLDDYRAARECYEEMLPRWPRLEPLLAARCVESAGGLWCGFKGFSLEEQERIRPQLRDISDFCRSHISAALANTDMGPAGRLSLRLVAWPRNWALTLAQFINWIYRRKHRWPL